MKIVLLGYMASGKSIIAKELAHKLTVDYLDLDTYIERKENKSISKIFVDIGEIGFRLLENKYLKEVLELKSDFILALGGGTPCYSNNMALILKNSKSVYLKASITTLFKRLVSGKASRPLIKDIAIDSLKEFIAKHLFERNFFYNQATDFICVDSKSVNTITNELITLLKSN